MGEENEATNGFRMNTKNPQGLFRTIFLLVNQCILDAFDWLLY